MKQNDLYTAIKINPKALKFISQMFVSETILQELTDIKTAPSAYNQIKEKLKDDNNGLKMLACMLKATCYT